VRDILWKWEMPKKRNICLFKSYYMPILAYGAELGHGPRQILVNQLI
jgi:hypothetical protein